MLPIATAGHNRELYKTDEPIDVPFDVYRNLKKTKISANRGKLNNIKLKLYDKNYIKRIIINQTN